MTKDQTFLWKKNKETPLTGVQCFLLNAWMDSFWVTSTIACFFKFNNSYHSRWWKDHQLLMSSIMYNFFLLTPFRPQWLQPWLLLPLFWSSSRGSKVAWAPSGTPEELWCYHWIQQLSPGPPDSGPRPPPSLRPPSELPEPGPGRHRAELRQRSRHRQGGCNLHPRSAGPTSRRLHLRHMASDQNHL